MTKLLEGKVAVVTGAGHGIGRGHALELARQGARVVVNDLGSSVDGEGSSRDADLTVDLITERGGAAVANYGDVAHETEAKEIIDQADTRLGPLRRPGQQRGHRARPRHLEHHADDCDIVMRVHGAGTWLTRRIAASHWRNAGQGWEKDTGGRIINTTSGAGRVGNFGQTNYATAKAAIVG